LNTKLSRLISFLQKGLFIHDIKCLQCNVCNSLLQSGCQVPYKSDGYFLQTCHRGRFCVQRTTTSQNGYSYMERNCADDCSSRTNPIYDSYLNGYSTTVVNQCCTTDGCNFSTQIISSKLNLFALLFFNFIIVFVILL